MSPHKENFPRTVHRICGAPKVFSCEGVTVGAIEDHCSGYRIVMAFMGATPLHTGCALVQNGVYKTQEYLPEFLEWKNVMAFEV